MSKKGEKVDEMGSLTVQDHTTLIPALSVTPAKLVDDGVEVANISGLPQEFEDADTMSGFPPSVKFEKKGDCAFGEYIGMRENVGPNSSRVYELSAPAGKKGEQKPIVVWGGTALDRLFDSAYPPIQQGDRLAVIFLGEKGTKRNQNPVKLFSLKIKRMSMPGQDVETREAIQLN